VNPEKPDNARSIIGYDNVQFSKAANALRGMGLTHLSKSAQAIKELGKRGMAPD
jgi:lactoylglutathione lyase